ncbi:hypothetical protein PGT21_029807 [Puccinia graminis f. sp. tritici]|uniref:Uncharacterized protein n=1 Tax=Puccinia graminis f. sp. tritici TaxID=56615 RepID=A0A5B0NFP4_PUCGR|nr:hypothetical protein PGT21_029807 [Puccinia graminis f. sp. tritici]
MPLTSKLNLEVGARTWRFNSDDPVSGGIPKRGGYFETVPRAGRTKSKASSTVSSATRPPQPAPQDEPIAEVVPPDPGPSEEVARIEREKQIIAEEKLRIEEMNRQAQQTLEHAEMIRQKVTEAQELNALAAEKEAEQRLLHQQAIEEEKQQLLFEADRRLQQLREEVAVVKQKHEAELELWKERQERTLALESEAEARAKAREAAEEARASQRERELIQERADALERLKQEAIEEYKRTHEELRRAQEEQLRKELEDARQKILEESAARKASLEAEREATILKLKEEAQLEYQKQLDSHHQLGKETAEALKEASAKAAEEFKAQSQEAIKNLRSIASDSYPRSERSALQKSSACKTSSPHPTSDGKTPSSHKVREDKPIAPQTQPSASEEEILKKREAMRQKLLMGVFTPTVSRIHEWGIRSAPAPFPALVPSPSTWGSPANRQRANSVGQANLSTPFIPGSAMGTHLNPQQIAPLRGGYTQDGYSRPGNPSHPSRRDLYCNPSTAQTVNRMSAIVHASPAPPPAASTNSPNDLWGASNSNNLKPNKIAYHAPMKEPVKREQQFKYTGGSKEPYYPFDDSALPVTTMSTIRGFRVAAVYGHVQGVALRNSAKDLNEVTLTQERDQATLAMWRQAERKGANFVIGLKFQNTFISLSLTEILATGTAVHMVPSVPSIVSPADANENAEQKPLPSNKPGKAPKGTGMAGEAQNTKNKNKGKRNDEQASQKTDDSIGNVGWDVPTTEAESTDQADEDLGNSQNECVDNSQNGWVDFGAETNDPQKKKNEKKKQASQKKPQNDPSTGWSWNQAPEEQDDNDNDTTDAGAWSNNPTDTNNAGGWSNDFNTTTTAPGGWPSNSNSNTNAGGSTNEPKKGQKGKKDGGDESQKKGNKERGKQARGNAETHSSAAAAAAANDDDGSTKRVAPFPGSYGHMHPGAMMNRPQQQLEWSHPPNLPLVHSSKPWPHPGPPGPDYGDPRAMYSYRPGPGYEQEFWNRRAPGLDFHPMYHNYPPPFPMPAPVPALQYPYEHSQRPPMRVEWEAPGGDRNGYQHPGGDPHPSRSPNKPNGNQWNSAPPAKPANDEWANSNNSHSEPNSTSWRGEPSNDESQGSQNNPNKNPNLKGKVKNQTSKKGGGPPPQPEDDNSWTGWNGNAGFGNDDSNQQTNDSQSSWNTNTNGETGGWNTNKSESKKAGGSQGPNNSNNQRDSRRQKDSQNQNAGKSKTRRRSPPPSSHSSSPDNEETEDGDELAMGIFAGVMSANHYHLPPLFTPSAYPSTLPVRQFFFFFLLVYSPSVPLFSLLFIHSSFLIFLGASGFLCDGLLRWDIIHNIDYQRHLTSTTHDSTLIRFFISSSLASLVGA